MVGKLDSTLVKIIDELSDIPSPTEEKGCLLGRIVIEIGKRAASFLLGTVAVIATIVSIPFFAIALIAAVVRDRLVKSPHDLNSRTWTSKVSFAFLYAPMSSLRFFMIFFKGPEKS